MEPFYDLPQRTPRIELVQVDGDDIVAAVLEGEGIRWTPCHAPSSTMCSVRMPLLILKQRVTPGRRAHINGG